MQEVGLGFTQNMTELDMIGKETKMNKDADKKSDVGKKVLNFLNKPGKIKSTVGRPKGNLMPKPSAPPSISKEELNALMGKKVAEYFGKEAGAFVEGAKALGKTLGKVTGVRQLAAGVKQVGRGVQKGSVISTGPMSALTNKPHIYGPGGKTDKLIRSGAKRLAGTTAAVGTGAYAMSGSNKNASLNKGENMSFWEGFVKKAEKKKDTHQLRRAILGNPISSAVSAKKGKKTQAFGDALGHSTVETLKGLGKGTVGGAAVGGAAGAIGGAAKKSMGSKLLSRVGHGGASGALLGGLAGFVGGNLYGSIKGHHGDKATEIHQKYQKD